MQPSDWANLFDKQSLVLAFPGMLSGIFLTFVSRCNNEAMLPLSMVAIPVLFYLVLFINGWSIGDAREGGWVGEVRFHHLPVCYLLLRHCRFVLQLTLPFY